MALIRSMELVWKHRIRETAVLKTQPAEGSLLVVCRRPYLVSATVRRLADFAWAGQSPNWRWREVSQKDRWLIEFLHFAHRQDASADRSLWRTCLFGHSDPMLVDGGPWSVTGVRVSDRSRKRLYKIPEDGSGLWQWERYGLNVDSDLVAADGPLTRVADGDLPLRAVSRLDPAWSRGDHGPLLWVH